MLSVWEAIRDGDNENVIKLIGALDSVEEKNPILNFIFNACMDHNNHEVMKALLHTNFVSEFERKRFWESEFDVTKLGLPENYMNGVDETIYRGIEKNSIECLELLFKESEYCEKKEDLEKIIMSEAIDKNNKLLVLTAREYQGHIDISRKDTKIIDKLTEKIERAILEDRDDEVIKFWMEGFFIRMRGSKLMDKMVSEKQKDLVRTCITLDKIFTIQLIGIMHEKEEIEWITEILNYPIYKELIRPGPRLMRSRYLISIINSGLVSCDISIIPGSLLFCSNDDFDRVLENFEIIMGCMGDLKIKELSELEAISKNVECGENRKQKLQDILSKSKNTAPLAIKYKVINVPGTQLFSLSELYTQGFFEFKRIVDTKSKLASLDFLVVQQKKIDIIKRFMDIIGKFPSEIKMWICNIYNGFPGLFLNSRAILNYQRVVLFQSEKVK